MGSTVLHRGRRCFLQGSLGVGGLALLAGCGVLRVPGNQPKIPRIAVALAGTNTAALEQAFMQGLADRGYVEGQNLGLERRASGESGEATTAVAAELVALQPDIIVAGGNALVGALKRATTMIPIVFPVADPVAGGLVESLAHPGGNATGLSTQAAGVVTKRLELFVASVPGLSRVAVLWNPDNPSKGPEYQEAEVAATVLTLRLQGLPVRQAADFAPALQAAADAGSQGLFVLGETLTLQASEQLAAFAATRRLPSMYELREFVEVGGLMNYGVDRRDLWRRAAGYVDRILKGARPAELPVEQPTKFDFVINLKTAQALGLSIPPTVLQQATEILQ